MNKTLQDVKLLENNNFTVVYLPVTARHQVIYFILIANVSWPAGNYVILSGLSLKKPRTYSITPLHMSHALCWSMCNCNSWHWLEVLLCRVYSCPLFSFLSLSSKIDIKSPMAFLIEEQRLWSQSPLKCPQASPSWSYYWNNLHLLFCSLSWLLLNSAVIFFLFFFFPLVTPARLRGK